ncbi:MAG: N-acetylglucosamine-6-phosphate deacetylase [Alphaproteobacteria bacterium]|jgi:N-acetylglucosamine-6-phosphate deacetylase|nr:N-acetylglucosamine-6-phosphate deacetylase [Alphaproteobacteria bacterium]MBU1551479.1 N-acetylglucosamine-6-phosphate deacetylase [Alphaproteobacteria bacterium]MBU2334685.1 N-acetylglucosamine-6-phosphate deacetylase [Alphaproteobacteria bacterium]MBU2386407.1 N-acetylglucosamine-6-phosphate deacetylase [Alphaproteobacteria bacterium]
MTPHERKGALTAVVAATLYDGTGADPLHEVAVVINGDIIDGVCPAGDLPGNVDITARSPVVTPGMIDLQINGAGGVLFNDRPTAKTLELMAAAARKGGTAFTLPTFITAHSHGLADAMSAVRNAIDQSVPGILGVHLEGPFLSPKRPGIHPKDAIRRIEAADLETLSGDIGGPRLITLAPEEAPDGAVRALSQSGAIVFAGHSEASYDEMVAAEAEGIRGATHLFNAMSQIGSRAPGAVGGVFDSRKLVAGIIADGFHVHPANLRLAFRVLGPARLFLVTDAMSTLGTDLKEFRLLGKNITLKDGRLVDSTGTLAGAHVAMDECVQTMIRTAGVSPAQAVQMATSTPAHAIGLGDRIGRVAKGFRAALSLMSGQFKAEGVFLDGKLYRSSPPD